MKFSIIIHLPRAVSQDTILAGDISIPRGFVKVFADEPAICTANLFATSIAMFIIVIILMIATMCPSFQSILPYDIENIIAAGQANLRRFSRSVKEFEWHTVELDKLDQACRFPGIGRVFDRSHTTE